MSMTLASPLVGDERTAILDAVRAFARSELAPHALEWDEEKHFPRDVLAAAGELGLGGVYVREDVGGAGLARQDAVAIFEELAMGDPTIAAYISIHNMVAWMIDTYGSAAQRQEWLPRLVSMTELGAYCLTEPGAGSDAAALTTSAVCDGGDYVLTGVKQFISAPARRPCTSSWRGPGRPARGGSPRSSSPPMPRASRSARTRRRWAGTRSPHGRSCSTRCGFRHPWFSASSVVGSRSR